MNRTFLPVSDFAGEFRICVRFGVIVARPQSFRLMARFCPALEVLAKQGVAHLSNLIAGHCHTATQGALISLIEARIYAS